jgi:hypothetical protein
MRVMMEPTDIIEKALACPSAAAGIARAPSELDDGAGDRLSIIDDLGLRPAISAAELDVVERFFADILDMVLSGDGGEAPSSSHDGLP